MTGWRALLGTALLLRLLQSARNMAEIETIVGIFLFSVFFCARYLLCGRWGKEIVCQSKCAVETWNGRSCRWFVQVQLLSQEIPAGQGRGSQLRILWWLLSPCPLPGRDNRRELFFNSKSLQPRPAPLPRHVIRVKSCYSGLNLLPMHRGSLSPV